MSNIFKSLNSANKILKKAKTKIENQIFKEQKNKFINLIKSPQNVINKAKYKLERFKSEEQRVKVFKIINLPKFIIEKAQDQLENQVINKQANVMLKPSTFFVKSITWTLIGGSFLGITWLGLAKTEEIVVVQGKLEPIKKVIDVQIPSGNVVHEVLIKEGEMVKKDQLLLILDKKSSLNKVETAKKILDYNKEVLSELKVLSDEGAVSKLQYIQQASQVAQLESQYTQEKIILDYQEIRAPISGKIFEIKPTGKGFVASTSEPVLKIVPNDRLKAKIEIESRSIGFVSVGKKADISIDSFPATDFGVIKGIIKSIGSDALPPDIALGKGYRFPADITLRTQELKLKDGSSLPLQVGMSLTANIKLRKISYLQLLLGTFQDKADSLRSL